MPVVNIYFTTGIFLFIIIDIVQTFPLVIKHKLIKHQMVNVANFIKS